jgi:hypothetical protein
MFPGTTKYYHPRFGSNPKNGIGEAKTYRVLELTKLWQICSGKTPIYSIVTLHLAFELAKSGKCVAISAEITLLMF